MSLMPIKFAASAFAACVSRGCSGVIAALIVAVLVLSPGCDRSKAEKNTAQAQPPKIPSTAGQSAPVSAKTEDALLLLDEGPVTIVEGHADNSRCEVCHLNLVAEELVLQHAKVKISCARCHGESDAHIADESWGSGGNGTAPDKMFPPAKINPMCYECHPRDKLDYKTHRTFLEGVSEEKFCVNCHGKHKLLVRKCKWK